MSESDSVFDPVWLVIHAFSAGMFAQHAVHYFVINEPIDGAFGLLVSVMILWMSRHAKRTKNSGASD